MAGAEWIYWIAGGLVGIGGLGVAAWALLWDRARGRPRCPKCWYEMGAATKNDAGRYVCPECGHALKKIKHVLKTRRHLRWAMLGIALIAAGAGAALTPRVQDKGWLSLTPTTALIAVLPMIDDPQSPVVRELSSRHWQHPPWGWQRDWLIEQSERRLDRADGPRRWAFVVLVLGPFRHEASAIGPRLIRGLESDDPAVRVFAAIGCGWFLAEPEIGVPALITALKDEDLKVRDAAARSLGQYGEYWYGAEAAVPALTELLDDESPSIRVQAAAALGAILPDPGAVIPVLISVLETEDWVERTDSVMALRRLLPRIKPVPETVIDAFINALGDENESVRGQAARGLGEIGAPAARATPSVVPLLQDEWGFARYEAARALGMFGPDARDALPALRDLANDTDSDVADAAAEAVRLIGQGS